MKPRLIPLLDQCIENGFAQGWRKAHKHTENPKEEFIREQVRIAIWDQLHEWFDFNETDPQPLFDDWPGGWK